MLQEVFVVVGLFRGLFFGVFLLFLKIFLRCETALISDKYDIMTQNMMSYLNSVMMQIADRSC